MTFYVMRRHAQYNKIYFSCSLFWELSSHIILLSISHCNGLKTIIAPSFIREDNCLDVVFMQLSLLEIFNTSPPQV